jgi:hypothetical protein
MIKRTINQNILTDDETQFLWYKGEEVYMLECTLDDEFRSGVAVKIKTSTGETYDIDAGYLYDKSFDEVYEITYPGDEEAEPYY